MKINRSIFLKALIYDFKEMNDIYHFYADYKRESFVEEPTGIFNIKSECVLNADVLDYFSYFIDKTVLNGAKVIVEDSEFNLIDMEVKNYVKSKSTNLYEVTVHIKFIELNDCEMIVEMSIKVDIGLDNSIVKNLVSSVASLFVYSHFVQYFGKISEYAMEKYMKL